MALNPNEIISDTNEEPSAKTSHWRREDLFRHTLSPAGAMAGRLDQPASRPSVRHPQLDQDFLDNRRHRKGKRYREAAIPFSRVRAD